jgi:hypothetical protein
MERHAHISISEEAAVIVPFACPFPSTHPAMKMEAASTHEMYVSTRPHDIKTKRLLHILIFTGMKTSHQFIRCNPSVVRTYMYNS